MVEGGAQQGHRDLWPWQKEVRFLKCSLLKSLQIVGVSDCGSCCRISAAWQSTQAGEDIERS